MSDMYVANGANVEKSTGVYCLACGVCREVGVSHMSLLLRVVVIAIVL